MNFPEFREFQARSRGGGVAFQLALQAPPPGQRADDIAKSRVSEGSALPVPVVVDDPARIRQTLDEPAV